MQHDNVLKKTNFDLLTLSLGSGGGGGGLQAKYLLPCYCISDYLKFDMQRVHVLIKLNFDLLTPSLGSGGGGGGVCRQTICYHVIALVILFSLICNVSVF